MKHLGPYFRGLGTKGNVVVGEKEQALLTLQGRALEIFHNLTTSDVSYLEQYYKEDLEYFGYTWKYQEGDYPPSEKQVHTSCVHGKLNQTCC
jgi:hypothetical protein